MKLFLLGISEQADEELVQHTSSLCALYHPQRVQNARYIVCFTVCGCVGVCVYVFMYVGVYVCVYVCMYQRTD